MSAATGEHDCLHRFLFARAAVRGEWVHLDAVWKTVLERREYPPAIRRVLGEALAASALLSATIKFAGLLTLQIQSRGPLRLLVVQCTRERLLRGLARWEGPVTEAPLSTLCGDGTLAITIDPQQERQQRYQGIVDLAGPSLAATLEGYFSRSEQLPTRLHLTADRHTAAGLLLQRLPAAAADPKAWSRIETLSAALTGPELLALNARGLLRRLFPQDDVHLFEAQPVGFRCTCSRARTAGMLRALEYQELRGMLAEQGRVEVTCEFCGMRYHFDPVDIEGLFVAALAPGGSGIRH